MRAKDALDLALHALGGAGIALVFGLTGHPLVLAAAIPVALVFGIAREARQRDWPLLSDFSAHAWTEAIAWGIGAALAVAAIFLAY